MENKASITALMSAFGRAYHTEYEKNPVFSDFEAKRLLSNSEYENMKQYLLDGVKFFEPGKTFKDEEKALLHIINTYIAATPLCRSAYCENALCTSEKTGTEQYVILGAGFDTFALRNKEFVKKHKVYELDQPKTQQDKIKRVHRGGFEIPENLIFAEIDFNSESLFEKLTECGFDKTKKTFFSLLGVSYYLSRRETENLLKEISKVSSDGSTLVFDYADEGAFFSNDRRVLNMVQMAKSGGEEMKSSYNYMSMDNMLSDFGFLIYEFMTPSDIQGSIIGAKNMTAFPNINYVQAVFKERGQIYR